MTDTLRILVLDDNVEVAEGVAEILEISGYDVRLVHDGESAVTAFCSGQFDMGLFDVRMPGKNGVEAYLEIRESFPNAKIALMSGYAEDSVVQTALDNGALGLLCKPFDPEAMLELVAGVEKCNIAAM